MREQRIKYILLALLTAFGLVFGITMLYAQGNAAAITPAAAPSTTQVQQLKSNETGLHFILRTPPALVDDETAVHIAGLNAQVQEPGAPALPYYVTYIILPPEAAVSAQIRAFDMKTSQVNDVLSVPRPNDRITAVPTTNSIDDSDAINGRPPALVNAPDPAIYQQNTLYPAVAYTISEPMYYHDVRLVKLQLYPVRYNPAARQLQQTQLDVNIIFHNTQPVRNSAPTTNPPYLRSLSTTALNYEQALNWRSFPAKSPASTAAFPDVGELYKIELNQDGIYDISGADLAAAGMNISSVDPANLQMMVRGEPVALQIINDNGDNQLDPTEIVRFYGWAFDGPRTEKHFIVNNVFWLWAGDSPARIITTTNQTGGSVVTDFVTAVTAEPETIFSSTYTDQWDTFPNQPDDWYWDYIKQNALSTPTQTYQITLPHPAAAGPNALYTVELLSREKSVDPTGITYTVRAGINNDNNFAEAVWTQEKSVNITNAAPMTELTAQENDIHLIFDSSSDLAEILLNRITVTYTRRLIADNNQLTFTDQTGGLREFQIGGFTEGTAANTLIWDITDPHTPAQITITDSDISGSGSFTYTVGSPTGGKFIASTTANILNPAAISQYIPENLDAPGGADWIAISHVDFLTQANILAAHRADFSGLQTWVVDYEDVVNQFGYGLPLPSAIRDYLAYAQSSWPISPNYAVLFGSATLNPRNLDCQHSTCPEVGDYTWDKDQPTYLVTDLVYKDRFQGLIPSDHTMTLLSGDDLLPDIAIGRITADSAIEAEAAVSKIILYEQSLSAPWQQRLLFVADNADDGGNFHDENELIADQFIPGPFSVTQRWLETNSQAETDALRAAISVDINGDGAAIVNYRGHGGPTTWASPSILSTTSTDFWTTTLKPTVILSADCLDGNFAFPGIPALSKTFLTLQNSGQPVGTAAHWSSTGLGYTDEHSVLHQNFYAGLFDFGYLTIGDAVNHAKLIYNQEGYHDSEMYSFMLQGDPAMQILVTRQFNFLPAIVSD